MDEARLKLLHNCQEMFLKYGVRSITLSDIAAQLGMSKKTIYQIFPDKEALISAAVQQHINEECVSVATLMDSARNPVLALQTVFNHVYGFLQQTNPAIVFELKKYYPKVWEIFENYKRETIYSLVLENIRNGQRLGLYRPEAEAEVLAAYYIEVPDLIFKTYAKLGEIYPVHVVYRQITQHFLRGLCTAEGLQQLHDAEAKPALPHSPVP